MIWSQRRLVLAKLEREAQTGAFYKNPRKFLSIFLNYIKVSQVWWLIEDDASWLCPGRMLNVQPADEGAHAQSSR